MGAMSDMTWMLPCGMHQDGKSKLKTLIFVNPLTPCSSKRSAIKLHQIWCKRPGNEFHR